MKYIRELIITVLIAGLVWLAYEASVERKNLKQHEEAEKILKARLDSVIDLQHKADIEAILALTKLEVAKSTLAEQSKVTEKYKLRYEALRHTAVPRLSDAQIDSAVRRLYPIR